MYKVGDLVKVRSYTDLLNEFGTDRVPNSDGSELYFNPRMKIYSGKIFKIETIEYRGNDNIQEFSLSDNGKILGSSFNYWLFNTNMVYPAEI